VTVVRLIDKKATKIARARHQRGVDKLRAFFAWDADEALVAAREKKASFSPVERRRRRMRTKAQRMARRKNRA